MSATGEFRRTAIGLSRAVERYRQGSYRPPAPPIFPYLRRSDRDYRGGGGCGGGCRRRSVAAAVAVAVGRLAVDAEAEPIDAAGFDPEMMNADTRLRIDFRFSFLGALLGFGNITIPA